MATRYLCLISYLYCFIWLRDVDPDAQVSENQPCVSLNEAQDMLNKLKGFVLNAEIQTFWNTLYSLRNCLLTCG